MQYFSLILSILRTRVIINVVDTKIRLRDFKLSDKDTLVRLANNKNMSQYLMDTFPCPYTEEDALWWIETGSKEGDAFNRVIEYKDEFAGSIGLLPQSGWRSHISQIGYWLGEPYWNKGIATTSVKIMTKIGLEDMGYRKLYAPVLAPNLASMRVLEKVEYSLEGVLKSEVFKNGQYFDIYHYAKGLMEKEKHDIAKT